MTLPPDIDDRKDRARVWFENLRDQLHAAFEALEDEASPDLYPGAAGRFESVGLRAGNQIAQKMREFRRIERLADDAG